MKSPKCRGVALAWMRCASSLSPRAAASRSGFDAGDEGADFRGFSTLIHLPVSLCVIPPEFARVSCPSRGTHRLLVGVPERLLYPSRIFLPVEL